MDRRQAIKNISLSLGYALTGSTIISLFNSCTSKNTISNFNVLNDKQRFCIENLADIIIPKSSSPGALDVNIIEFIDVMVSETLTNKEQDIFLKGSLEFEKKINTTYEKDLFKVSKDEFQQVLKSYFLISEEKKNAVFSLIKEDFEKVSSTVKENYLIYKFLITIREFSLFGYYTSQIVTEDVLKKDSHDNYYKGCVTL
tara:strand:+ start:371 stop:967 length:597 start_codon:yes stop_codon:yes gene_type:complete